MIDQATADFFIDRALELFGDDFSDEQLDALLAEKRPIILTDRYAPVDQMLAAVFLDRAPKQ